MAYVVTGPDALLGATLSVIGDGRVPGRTLDEGPTGQAATDRATALPGAGRTARVAVGGDADTCPERLSMLVHVAAARPRMPIFGAVDSRTRWWSTGPTIMALLKP